MIRQYATAVFPCCLAERNTAVPPSRYPEGGIFGCVSELYGDDWNFKILKAPAPDLSELTDDQKPTLISTARISPLP